MANNRTRLTDYLSSVDGSSRSINGQILFVAVATEQLNDRHIVHVSGCERRAKTFAFSFIGLCRKTVRLQNLSKGELFFHAIAIVFCDTRTSRQM